MNRIGVILIHEFEWFEEVFGPFGAFVYLEETEGAVKVAFNNKEFWLSKRYVRIWRKV